MVGALLIPFNAFWIVRLERVMFGPYPSTISLFANVVFALFALVGLNSILRWCAPRIAFSQGELITIYTMLAISTGLAGLDGPVSLNEEIGHGAWFGPANHWSSFLGSFPKWLTVSNRSVLKGHYLGHSTFYQASVLRAWIGPLLAWTLFIVLLLGVAQCLNVLVRRQWADRERLTFPITWLPMSMTDEGGAFYRERLLWAGFAIAAIIGLWNGIAFLYPSLPSIPVGITDLKPLLVSKPWSAIDWLPITLYPMVIGIGFLLPLDLLFSCWFFYFFWKLQPVAASQAGWDTTPDFPFIKEQGFGAVMALAAYYVWGSRQVVARSVRGAFAGVSTGEGEALSERAALGGVLAGLVGLVAFCAAAGVALWVACAFLAIYLLTLLVVARIRAELGSPVHDFHFMGPDNMIPRALGTGALRQSDMAFFTFSYAFTRAHRSDTMPVGLEGLQMARTRSLEQRRMLAAILLATALGAASAFWAFEHQAYELGASAKFNQGIGQATESFNRMAAWVSAGQDQRPNRGAITAMVVGFLTAMLLLLLRLRFYGFPFHPIGYAVASSWAINLVWLPLLIAWMLKGLTLRYGGLGAYRRYVPFFLGLILGDCVMGSLWALMSLLLNTRTYNFFGS